MNTPKALLTDIIAAASADDYGSLMNAIQAAADWINDPYQASDEAAAFRKGVSVSEGATEVDDNAIVSLGDDDGAYVQAWIWVSDDEAGLNPRCDNCGERYAGDGDGFDGMCPSCADKDESTNQLAEAFDQFTIGSQGFIEHIETHCAFDISRSEIERISMTAKDAAEFHSIWENSDHWTDENNPEETED